MSMIGAGNFGLASSIVGSSRPESAANPLHAASAEQRALASQKEQAAQAFDDVADADFSSDRDADGRLLYRRPDPTNRVDESESEESLTSRPADAFGDRGKSLDLDA
jgi:hypothetical protein